MRRIDLHCYPGTQEWISSQGPYVEALGKYWGKEWVGKSEEDVVADVKAAGVEAVLVAFDIESVTGAPPCTNSYVAALRDRHPATFIGAWGAVDPFKGERAIAEATAAVREHHVLGFHFHPIMGHYAVDEPALNPLFETIAGLGVPVMIDVGTTGMGAGMPGGLGARIEHARPLAIDNLAARFPALTIIAAHPGWTWSSTPTPNAFWGSEARGHAGRRAGDRDVAAAHLRAPDQGPREVPRRPDRLRLGVAGRGAAGVRLPQGGAGRAGRQPAGDVHDAAAQRRAVPVGPRPAAKIGRAHV